MIFPEKVPAIEGMECPFLSRLFSLLFATESRIGRIVLPGSGPCQVNRSAHAGPKRCRSLVVAGTRNQEIADQLNLSEHTVRNYLLRIFDKLGISSRVELVLYAFSGTEGNVTSENSKTFSASA